MKKNLFIILILLLISCNYKNISIEPIDKRFNDQGLQFQYYEISDYKNFSEEDLLNKLENFVKNKYPIKKYKDKEVCVFFYKKSIFENYKDDLSEIMEKDPDFGTIGKYRGNLIAKIIYGKIDENKKSYTCVLFDNNDNQKMIRKNTVLIK